MATDGEDKHGLESISFSRYANVHKRKRSSFRDTLAYLLKKSPMGAIFMYMYFLLHIVWIIYHREQFLSSKS